MSLPLHQLSKKEYKDRLTFRCVHRHNGLPIKGEHPNCYDETHRLTEKIGFLDIESSNLVADFGIVYTYCLKELDGKIFKRAVTREELYSELYDKNLLQQFIKDSEPFSRLIVHYGSDYKFDIPFLRSRAIYWRLPFPEYKFIYISDTFNISKSKLKLHNNRLETLCEFLNIPCKRHKLRGSIWLKMITGNPKVMKYALDYIMRHNIEDVISLEAAWKRIHKYALQGKRSI